MNPLIDFTTKTTEELLELNKKYTQKLYTLNGSNPLYNQVLGLRDAVQLEYQERMQMQIHKDKLKQNPEQTIEIGEISGEVFDLDLPEEQKLINNVAHSYTQKAKEEAIKKEQDKIEIFRYDTDGET
jgi:hypothetical protein